LGRRSPRTLVIVSLLDQQHPRRVVVMGDKSPKKANAKKPGKSLKEKRQAKHEKNQTTRGLGAS
jgi:hypothetical protein